MKKWLRRTETFLLIKCKNFKNLHLQNPRFTTYNGTDLTWCIFTRKGLFKPMLHAGPVQIRRSYGLGSKC